MSGENKGRANYNADDMLDNLFEELGLNDFMKKYDALMSDGKTEEKTSPVTDEVQPDKELPTQEDPFDALDRKTAEVKSVPSFADAVKSHAELYFDSEAGKEESFDIVMQNPYAEPLNKVDEEEPQNDPDQDEGENGTETGENDTDDGKFVIHIDDYDDFDVPPVAPPEDKAEPEVKHTNAPAHDSVLDSMFDFDQRDMEDKPLPPVSTQPASVDRPKKKKKGFKAWLTVNAIPMKGDSVSEVIRKIFFVISVITIIVCLSILANIYIIEPNKANRNISNMSELNNNTQPVVSADEEKAKYPDVDFPEGILASAVKWYAKNSDYAGWIKIPGAEIDCALAQANDNKYYLRRDFYKQSTRYGCPFVSSANNLRNLDRNTTIFGHNMENDDLLFGKLEQYLTVDGYKKAPIIEFSTPYAEYKCKIYAVFITNSKEKDDNGYCFYYFYNNLSTTKNFEDYIKQLDQRKLYSTGVDINADDKLLTLSTCSYDFEDARLVVVARLVRDGESAQVDTSRTVINTSPRYPQAWYDAKGKTNPYKDAELWYKD